MEINWVGEILDTCFSLMGKGGRLLNNYGRRACFLIWMVCALYWSARDFHLHLYSQGFFCLVSVGMHIHGFYNWKKNGIGK